MTTGFSWDGACLHEHDTFGTLPSPASILKLWGGHVAQPGVDLGLNRKYKGLLVRAAIRVFYFALCNAMKRKTLS